MAAIFYVSSLPQPLVPPGGDKPWHLLAYLGLGVLTLRAVAGGLGAWISWRAAVVAVAIAIGYAVTDELHQMFVPGRSAELNDLLADAMGVVAGASLVWLWGLVARQRPEAAVSRDV
jgi:VanZ family protein